MEKETTKITKFTRGILDDLRDNIDDALAPLGEQFGIKFGLASITNSDTKATLTLEIGVAGYAVKTKTAEAFEEYAARYGLRPEDLGSKFLSAKGEEFTIVGAKPINRTSPILGRSTDDGVTYKFTATAVATGLKKYENTQKTV